MPQTIPQAIPKILMYCTHVCPYCTMAERLLTRKNAKIDKIFVDDAPDQREEMMRITQRRTVPQIFIGDRHVGGYTDLAALDQSGELDTLLGQ
jgi:glutaredoxin 3